MHRPARRRQPRARPLPGRGARRARHRPRRDPPRAVALALGARRADRARAAPSSPSGVGELIDRGPRHRGRRRAEHRRPAAAPADVPGRCRPSPRRGPRRHEHRRRPDDPRWPDPGPSRRAGSHRGGTGGGARTASTTLFDPLLAHDPGACPVGCGASASACPGPVEFETGRPISPPIMPGWDGYPIRERFAARYEAPGLGRQRRQRAGPRGVAIGRRGRPRQRRRHQDRDRHRGRHHLGRPPAPRRAGQCRRRRPHPGHRTTRPSSAAAATSAASRRWPAARPSAGPARPPRSTAAARGCETALDQHGARDRRGRRAGRVVRRSGRGRAARRGRPARRLDARERRQLLQPVAHRHRRRGREQRRTSSWPRSARRSTAGRCRWRLATCASSARRSVGWPGSSARRRWSSTSSSRASSLARWIEAGEPSGAPEVAEPLAHAG